MVHTLKTQGTVPKGMRAGDHYYSVRDNGQVKKVVKTLRVVLELPDYLEFEEIEETAKGNLGQTNARRNSKPRLLQESATISKTSYTKPCEETCNSQFKAVYKKCHKIMRKISESRSRK